MNILFLSSEVQGLLKTGGLADVARALPKQLQQQGHDVRVVMPCYRSLLGKHFPVVLPTLIVPLTPTDTYFCSVRQTELDGVTVYLIEHNQFFGRHGVYDDGEQGYQDNGLRFAFLSKAALELARALDFQPDTIQANDWQTAISGYYLKHHYPFDDFFANTGSVLTVHNGAYQGKCPGDQRYQLGIAPEHMHGQAFEDWGQINLLKGGLFFADKANAVSPGYREELREQATGHGLYLAFRAKGDDLVGILNGCDYGEWNPSTDPALPFHYDAQDMVGKKQNKLALQQELGLTQDANLPLFANISRLTGQKGFQMLVPALYDLVNQGVQVVILGSGELSYAFQLQELARRFPDNLRFIYGYDEALSHRIEAASDFFMMPSVFEPCGLNQIYSLRYGSLPIVRATGGLKDTVEALAVDESNQDLATGFSFDGFNFHDLTWALKRAEWIWYNNPSLYQKMQQLGMRQSFTWQQACADYLALYEQAMLARSESLLQPLSLTN